MSEAPPTLTRALGLFHVTAGGVGNIIGAGIYVLIGEATAEAGATVWASFLLAAVLCVLTGLSYAELSSAYPTAAAEYDYSRRAFPRWVAFLVGWVMVTGLVVAAAAVSLGFGRYLAQFFDVDATVAGVILLVALFGVGASGIRQAGNLILILSLVQVAGLVGVIAIGLPSVGDHSLTASPGATGIIAGAALVFFAFIGFDEVITLAEEAHEPARTVPRALLIALAISTLLYIGTAVAAVSAIGAEALAQSERPLADVVATAAGGRSGDIVAAAALVSTTNTTLLALMAASRMTYGMAKHDAVPRWLGRVTRGTRVPLRSLALMTGLAIVAAIAGDLKLLAEITDLAVYLVFVAVNGAVILLRFRDPGVARPVRTPFSIARLPILPVGGILSVFVLIGGLDLSAALTGAAVCAAGLAGGLVLDARSPVRLWLAGTGGTGR